MLEDKEYRQYILYDRIISDLWMVNNGQRLGFWRFDKERNFKVDEVLKGIRKSKYKFTGNEIGAALDELDREGFIKINRKEIGKSLGVLFSFIEIPKAGKEKHFCEEYNKNKNFNKEHRINKWNLLIAIIGIIISTIISCCVRNCS